MNKKYLPLLLSILSLGIFFISINTSAPNFLHTTELNWQRLNGLIPCNGCSSLQANELSLYTDPNSDFNRSRSATSAEIKLVSNLIQIQIAGDLKDPRLAPALVLLKEDKEIWEQNFPTKDVKLEKDKWSSYQFELPLNLIDSSVNLKIRTKPTTVSGSWLSIRNKVDFFEPNGLFNQLSNRLRSLYLNYISAILASILLSYLFIFKASSINKYLGFFLFAATFLVHFRVAGYFNYDEWDQINMARLHGIKAIFIPHNEHFKPIFFLLYYLENSLFEDHYFLYLLVSSFLFTYSALLLKQFVETIFPSINKNTSTFICLLYCTSSLNCENLQWAFEQCLLLMQVSFLIGFINLIKYLETKKSAYLIKTAVFCIIAPFCFGNGLILFPTLGIISLLYLILQQKLKLRFPQFLRVNFLNLVFFSIAAILYKISKNPTTEATTALNLEELFKYFYVGTMFSGFLRSTGLAPFVESHNLESFLSYLKLGVHSSLIYLSHIAVILLILIFLKIRKDSVNKSRAILTFLIGLSVVLVAMLLPAIGRSAFGTTQSLSLRYHSITLAGSLILLSPLIEIFFYNQRKKRILFLYSSLVVSCQLIVGSNFVYFVDQDKLNKTYSAQLLNWQESGKPEHLQPQYPDNLVPGGNPDFVYQNLLWLK